MISICMTYFRSLTLLNLEQALYSVGRQDLSEVSEIILVDNNTEDSIEAIEATVQRAGLPMAVRVISRKHGDKAKTHSWSTNAAVYASQSSRWIFFTRADYILDGHILFKFRKVIESRPSDWRGFITGNVYHLHVDVGECNKLPWRDVGASLLRTLPGREEDYTEIDSGVWMTQFNTFREVGGLDERLTAWGHAQTDFQHRIYETGVEFVRIPELLFFHPLHAGERNIEVAHRQLAEKGINIRDMWKRYTGRQPYASL